MISDLTTRRSRHSWRVVISLALVFSVLMSCGVLAKNGEKKRRREAQKRQLEEMRKNQGPILLSGLVFGPVASDTSAKDIGDGMNHLPGCRVEIVGTGLVTTTDGRGYFKFNQGPTGPVTVIISKPGYKSETISSKIIGGAGVPENLSVELLPEGTQFVGRTPTGLGTLYVAFSPKIVDHSGAGHSTWDNNLMTVPAIIANGGGPLNIEGPSPFKVEDGNISKKKSSPVSGADKTIMIYPPGSPARIGFHNTTAAPQWLCFDGSGDTLYVSNASRQIQILDATNQNRVIHNLPVQESGFVTDLKLSATGQYMMAAVMAASPGVMMIDTRTKQPAAYLSVDGVGTMVPTAIASTRSGQHIFVVLDGQAAQGGQGLLAVIDAFTGETVKTVPVGAKPTGLAFSGDGRFAYVVNSSGGNVTVINLANLQALGTIAVGVSPQEATVTPDGRRLLVANKGSATVSVIDTVANQVVGTVPVGKGATDVKVSPDGRQAYVSNREDSTISVIDLNTMNVVFVTEPMPRSSPIGIAVRPGI